MEYEDGMFITVKVTSEKELDLFVKNDFTTEDLKHLIDQNLNYPVKQQRLFYDGRVLQDFCKLSFYGVKPDCTIYLIPKNPSSSPSFFNSRIFTPLSLSSTRFLSNERSDVTIQFPRKSETATRSNISVNVSDNNCNTASNNFNNMSESNHFTTANNTTNTSTTVDINTVDNNMIKNSIFMASQKTTKAISSQDSGRLNLASSSSVEIDEKSENSISDASDYFLTNPHDSIRILDAIVAEAQNIRNALISKEVAASSMTNSSAICASSLGSSKLPATSPILGSSSLGASISSSLSEQKNEEGGDAKIQLPLTVDPTLFSCGSFISHTIPPNSTTQIINAVRNFTRNNGTRNIDAQNSETYNTNNQNQYVTENSNFSATTLNQTRTEMQNFVNNFCDTVQYAHTALQKAKLNTLEITRQVVNTVISAASTTATCVLSMNPSEEIGNGCSSSSSFSASHSTFSNSSSTSAFYGNGWDNNRNSRNSTSPGQNSSTNTAYQQQ